MLRRQDPYRAMVPMNGAENKSFSGFASGGGFDQFNVVLSTLNLRDDSGAESCTFGGPTGNILEVMGTDLITRFYDDSFINIKTLNSSGDPAASCNDGSNTFHLYSAGGTGDKVFIVERITSDGVGYRGSLVRVANFYSHSVFDIVADGTHVYIAMDTAAATSTYEPTVVRLPYDFSSYIAARTGSSASERVTNIAIDDSYLYFNRSGHIERWNKDTLTIVADSAKTIDFLPLDLTLNGDDVVWLNASGVVKTNKTFTTISGSLDLTTGVTYNKMFAYGGNIYALGRIGAHTGADPYCVVISKFNSSMVHQVSKKLSNQALPGSSTYGKNLTPKDIVVNENGIRVIFQCAAYAGAFQASMYLKDLSLGKFSDEETGFTIEDLTMTFTAYSGSITDSTEVASLVSPFSNTSSGVSAMRDDTCAIINSNLTED